MEGLRKRMVLLLLSMTIAKFHFGTCEAKQGQALMQHMNAQFVGNVGVENWGSFDEVTRVLPQHGLKERDEIVGGLPGQPEGVEFKQYAGYVTVDEKAGRALFYYLAEAVNPLSKPVLLWLNGVANLLFLESPAGVGFSYSNTSSDYDLSGDKRTASDAYTFLINWFERFPEYKNSDFYISGESYAGHYVPQLAYQVLWHNQMATKTIINLKGIAIGNPWIDVAIDTLEFYEYLWTHAILPDEIINAINKYCNFSLNRQSIPCSDTLSQLDISSIDMYNIYAPICNTTNKHKPCASDQEYDPCTDDYVEMYLNLPQVQKALHANVTGLENPWFACNGMNLYWKDAPLTVLPLIKNLTANGIRVMLYSGDVDARVPVTGTRKATKKLNLDVQTRWLPWYNEGEVGGYSVIYKGGLTFATVRGAGHEVPSYQPARSLTLINAFLEGKPLPSS
ncbi:hypothetical protein AMTRI_Chr01g104640 [Amborella trichopoda]